MKNILNRIFSKNTQIHVVHDHPKKPIFNTPLNIELAKQGHPVCLRNGTNCNILQITHDNRVLISIAGTNEQILHYENGFADELEESGFDLMMKTPSNYV